MLRVGCHSESARLHFPSCRAQTVQNVSLIVLVTITYIDLSSVHGSLFPNRHYPTFGPEVAFDICGQYPLTSPAARVDTTIIIYKVGPDDLSRQAC